MTGKSEELIALRGYMRRLREAGLREDDPVNRARLERDWQAAERRVLDLIQPRRGRPRKAQP